MKLTESAPFRFDRMELAGSLGDLGTLLPIAIGMILICGINPTGLFFSVGVFYIFSGLYYRVTTPVQPMKVIGAYALATAMSPSQILASGLLMGIFLLAIGATGAMDVIRRYTPKPAIRGVQLALGALLAVKGIELMLGTSKLQLLRQASEPYLTVQALGPVPIGIVLGIAGSLLTLFFLENRKIPAALVVLAAGTVFGLLFGTRDGLADIRPGFYLPRMFGFAMPDRADFAFVLLAVVLPQLPMTLGNAVIANSDLSEEYFGKDSARVTPKALCLTMASANFISFVFGGMPLCHGAGGLAAHYRFGARTGGSNLIIGTFFICLTLLLGFHILSVLYLVPMAVLGVLLFFAGMQLTLTILDLKGRRELFIAMAVMGVTLASNLAAGFIAGLVLAHLLRSERFHV